MMFIEKMLIDLFSGQVQAPEVTLILVVRAFLGGIHDAQVHIMSSGGGHTGEVQKPVGRRFKNAVLPPRMVTALLNARSEIELAPFGPVGAAEIIFRGKMVAPVEIKFP